MTRSTVARRLGCALAMMAAMQGAALAGQTCSDAPPKATSIRMAFGSAVALQAALDSAHPQVALIARVGQDLSEYGLRYSHLGFVIKDEPSGQWRAMHLLNKCGTADSSIWKEGLANFFLDDLFSYESLLIVPSPEAQRKILAKLSDRAQYMSLFTPHYNMLAYPYATKYENSNQWVLELLAKAYGDTIDIDSREKAQQWLKLMGYEPTTLNLGPMKRLGGRMFRANVAFDDHPNERRFSDKIDIVTVDSMTRFIKKIDPSTTFTPIAQPRLENLVN